MKKPAHLENREAEGAKLVSPSALRNSGPIADILAKAIPKNSSVLEIASGTGQHGMAAVTLRPDVFWQYSDIDAPALASQRAYALENPQLLAPITIDVCAAGWSDGLEFDAVFCANMIHIAPSAALPGLARGSAKLLRSGGQLFLYGPFLKAAESAPSNLKFDRSLKARDPDWGVRELEIVTWCFSDQGFALSALFTMPANNDLLVFTKAD